MKLTGFLKQRVNFIIAGLTEIFDPCPRLAKSNGLITATRSSNSH
ncbi:MAG TPA: hypothetical protein VL069_16350 [Opitutus sp.]|nr:hypothetical protein [Opitutus sp.]